jgi:hypothetical protein
MEFKYSEDKTLKLLEEYVASTYSQHYTSADDPARIQVFDLWDSFGTLQTTCRDTAIKYLSRYGKKEGKNSKDLLKAIHYILIMIYIHNRDQAKSSTQ